MRLFTRKPDLKRCLVPEGTFDMGTPGESFDEGPVHPVTLSAFEMAQFPVRNRDYAQFLKRTGAEAPPFWREPRFSDPGQPVVGVSWYEAERYCKWLSELAGLTFRLPTEAEFEKAARAGLPRASYPWGNDRSKGGYRIDRGPLEGPYRCGLNPPNGHGLYDMLSNVHQWCLDGYDPEYYRSSPGRNPTGAEGAAMRAARGWSWTEEDLIGRCAARAKLSPYFRVHDFGFRWVIAYDSRF
jgi:formylglycine-generating enzyme required for sulfatase activity